VIPQLTIGHYNQWKKERRVTAILPNGVSKHSSGIKHITKCYTINHDVQ
jgi:hypothetical protein